MCTECVVPARFDVPDTNLWFLRFRASQHSIAYETFAGLQRTWSEARGRLPDAKGDVMAKRVRTRRSSSSEVVPAIHGLGPIPASHGDGASDVHGALLEVSQPTGAYLITYRDEVAQSPSTLRSARAHTESVLGLKHAADSRDWTESLGAESLERADGVVLSQIGIEVVNDPNAASMAEAVATLRNDSDSGVLAIEPEYFVSIIGQTGASMGVSDWRAYLQGFADASQAILKGAVGEDRTAVQWNTDRSGRYADDARGTWGLHATNVLASRFSGLGIKVAVLDTGVDLSHPDLKSRLASSRCKTFVPGTASVQDGQGHGTHCIGTVGGPAAPPSDLGQARYGCAPQCTLYVGKVLDDTGRGKARQPLAGMDWAIGEKCHVISMSLGYLITPGAPDSVAFETAARRGLERGTLTIAAAGNERQRGLPTRSPANVPSVLSVGAVDQMLAPASFSTPGDVNLAGPGVAILSTVPMPRRYGASDGTSMATPHTAGIAALWAESDPKLRGLALWRMLESKARKLPFPASDVGLGLVQAP